MKKCDDIRARMMFYLDDELQGSERSTLEAHLGECESCRAAFKNEGRFLTTIREVHPLHQAPANLRTRVQSLMRQTSSAQVAPAELRLRIQQFLGNVTGAHHTPKSTTPFFSVHSVRFAIGVLIAVSLIAGIWVLIKREGTAPYRQASEFAMMAAETHQRHLHGQLPLEIVSDLPQQISTWFADKLPFTVKLPNYQESSGQEKLYRLEGARLVGYKNDYAAYVAYQMRTRPISLVITSNAVAKPTGGEEIAAKGITFHYNSIQGFKVITWSDRGLTYALVSDLDERGQQSCLVCHQGTRDRDFIESLKPR